MSYDLIISGGTVIDGSGGPARRANAEAVLLAQTWGLVDEALRSEDLALAWRGFETARAACMKCHQAEHVAWMNDQPMFERRAPPHPEEAPGKAR